MIRSFIAIDLPESIQKAIGAFQDELRRTGAPVAWVKADRIHLTLKFLGNISVEKVEEIKRALLGVVVGFSPFHLFPSGCGAFPSLKQMRVIWVGLGGDLDALNRLHQRVEAAMADLGFQPEERPFKAHLTLGRIRGRHQLRSLQELVLEHRDIQVEGFDVGEVVLYKSDLKPEGAVYTPLFRKSFIPANT